MFLRAKVRKKDKQHRYFSVVENRRVGPHQTAQRTVLYLGDLPAVVAPSPCTNAALGFFSNFLYITGGHDQAGLTPGTWRHDLTAESWTQLMPSGVPGAGSHFGYDLDQTCGTMFLAFGDHDDGIDVSTTDLLSLSMSPLFARLPATTVPPPRRHAPLILDPQNRLLFTMGGLQGRSTVLGDTWIYRLGGCTP